MLLCHIPLHDDTVLYPATLLLRDLGVDPLWGYCDHPLGTPSAFWTYTHLFPLVMDLGMCLLGQRVGVHLLSQLFRH